MDPEMIRPPAPRPAINPQGGPPQQAPFAPNQYRPAGPPGSNAGPPRLMSNGPPQPYNVNRPLQPQLQPGQPRPGGPPPLQRTDSRPVLPAPGPFQPQQPPQQRPLGPPGQQPFNPNQPGAQRPLGPPGQPQFQPPRPINPTPGGQPPRGPQPGQQPPQLMQQNRPPFPNQQQPQRPPLQRPPGAPYNPAQPQQQFRGPAPGTQPQRPPLGPQPVRQPSYESTIDPRNMAATDAQPLSKIMSRPNSVLSNDDDDDVVIGRSSTPTGQSATGVRRPPSTDPTSYGQPQPQLQRSDSKLSNSSRPSSVADHHSKSPSPDPIGSSTTKIDPKPTAAADNLSRIPENNGSVAPSMPRPPSVTFSDKQPSPSGPVPPMSKNPTVYEDRGAALPERMSTPTSETFRTSPAHALQPDRPTNLPNGRGALKSSLKHSKGDNDSGVDETTQGHERHELGSLGSPLKSPSKIPGLSRPASATPSQKSQDRARATSRTRTLKTPDSPLEPVKKVPMNKVQVGNAPSPNLKQVRSKIGSLQNATHKPGGGNVKIESKKLEFHATSRIEASNEKYQPKGGEKKIITTKLQWEAKSKIGSLENASHKPGGGDKKIESIKTEFKDKAKPRVGSKDNVKHTPGGGDVKIITQKVDVKAQSKIGSMENMKHRPGGGDKKIFDDKEYLKNVDHPVAPSVSHPTAQPTYWPSTSLTSSMSLPAECIVLSVTSATSPRRKSLRRGSGGCPQRGRAFHPRPFRLY